MTNRYSCDNYFIHLCLLPSSPTFPHIPFCFAAISTYSSERRAVEWVKILFFLSHSVIWLADHCDRYFIFLPFCFLRRQKKKPIGCFFGLGFLGQIPHIFRVNKIFSSSAWTPTILIKYQWVTIVFPQNWPFTYFILV